MAVIVTSARSVREESTSGRRGSISICLEREQRGKSQVSISSHLTGRRQNAGVRPAVWVQNPRS